MFYTRFYKIWWQIGPFHSLNQHWGIVHPQSVSYVFFTHRLIKILKYFFNSARKFCFYGNNLFISRLDARENSGAARPYEETPCAFLSCLVGAILQYEQVRHISVCRHVPVWQIIYRLPPSKWRIIPIFRKK